MKKRLLQTMVTMFFATVIGLLAPIKTMAAPPPPAQSNFDARRYADAYADLKEAFGYDEAQLWQHYLTYGIYEGRTAFIKGVGPGITQTNFDARRYADAYADLKEAFGYDEAQLWLHYLTYGIYEGRQVHAKQPEPVVAEEPVQTEEPRGIVGPEPPLPEPRGIVGPEPPLPPVVGPEPPLPEEEFWVEVMKQEHHIYPASPGPWSRDDYDPNQEYIAIPGDDEWGLKYPEFLTPEEVRERYHIDPADLPDDYLERQEFIHGK